MMAACDVRRRFNWDRQGETRFASVEVGGNWIWFKMRVRLTDQDPMRCLATMHRTKVFFLLDSDHESCVFPIQ